MIESISYELINLISDSDKYLYGFEASGGKYKIVAHSFVKLRENRKVFNLGFGDFDIVSGEIIDDEVFNLGDGRIILNTVLSTIPLFFHQNPNEALLVQGSDSRDDFPQKCRQTCKKNCGDICRKQHQRIKIYCSFLDKHFRDLVKNYIFFGLTDPKSSDFEQYLPGTIYNSVLIYKKKS